MLNLKALLEKLTTKYGGEPLLGTSFLTSSIHYPALGRVAVGASGTGSVWFLTHLGEASISGSTKNLYMCECMSRVAIDFSKGTVGSTNGMYRSYQNITSSTTVVNTGFNLLWNGRIDQLFPSIFGDTQVTTWFKVAFGNHTGTSSAYIVSCLASYNDSNTLRLISHRTNSTTGSWGMTIYIITIGYVDPSA